MPVTAHSQLMTNHVPGVALSAQRRLHTVYSANHSPLLFALNDEHRLGLTLPSATSSTGWEELDLTAHLTAVPGLGQAPVVHSFAVSQSPDGGIWVVLAAAAGAGHPSRVYVSERMANTESIKDWTGLAAGLTERRIPDKLTVTDILVGGGRDGTPFSVVVTLDEGNRVEYHQINPDPAGTWSSTPVPLPQDATRVVSVAVGQHRDLGTGIYSLFELATLHSLVFTTLPVDFDGELMYDTVELDLPDGLAAAALATVANPDGVTDLYVGGDGVCRYSADKQGTSHLPTENLMGREHVRGVRDLVVAADQNSAQLSVWAIDMRDTLVYVEGSRSEAGSDYAWQQPLLLDTEVTALSAYRVQVAAEHERSSVAMALGGSDGGFRMLTQDPQTALWRHQTVALHTSSEVLPVQTYTTRVVVTDEDGNPLRDKEVLIEPDRDCASLVNSRYYALRAGTPKPARTDAQGVVTIVLETADLTAPVYTFHVDGDVALTADPGADTKDTLRGLTGDAIGNAKRNNGKPLFDTPPAAATRDRAAAAVGQLMQAHDDLSRRDARSSMLDSAPTFTAMGIQDGWVDVSVGDLLTALRGEVREVTDFLVRQIEDSAAWKFVVWVGEQMYEAVIEFAHQAVAAIDWVLEHTLGISLEDMIDWLGFVFSWDDILANHRVLAKVVTLSFDHVVQLMAESKKSVDDWFGTLRRSFVDDKLVVDTSSDIFAKRVGRDTVQPSAEHKKALDKPQASWGNHQLGGNLGQATPGEYIPDDPGDLLATVVGEEIAVIKQMADQIATVFADGLGNRTLSEIIEAVAEIIGLAVVNTLENMTLTVIDAAILVVKAVKAMLTSRWDIPVLTPLYEKVICRGDGSKLTLVDLICLLGAIPATIVGKAVLPDHANLFSSRQIEAVRAAKTWDAAVTALSVQPMRLAAAATPGAQTQAGKVFAVMNAFLRVPNVYLSIALDGSVLDPSGAASPRPLRLAKLALDWTGYVFGLIGAGLLAKKERTDRENLDIAITVLGIVPPTLGTIREIARLLAPSPPRPDIPLPDPPPIPDAFVSFRAEAASYGVADVTRFVDAGYGGLLVVLTCASFGLQVSEPHKDTDEATYGALLGAKMAQNLCAAVNSMLAPAITQQVADAQPELFGAAILGRALYSALRMDLQLARSVAQLAVAYTDFEGAVP